MSVRSRERVRRPSLFRPRLSLTVLVVLALGGWGGIAGPAILFQDVAEEAGLRFRHFIGATGSYFVPEIFGSGIAVLDYDGDGDLDIYILQGTILDPAKSLKDSLFPHRQITSPATVSFGTI